MLILYASSVTLSKESQCEFSISSVSHVGRNQNHIAVSHGVNTSVKRGILTVLHDPLPHDSLLPFTDGKSCVKFRIFDVAHTKPMYVTTGIDFSVYDVMFLC